MLVALTLGDRDFRDPETIEAIVKLLHFTELKQTIEELISYCTDFEELLRQIQEQGYEVKRGKYISFAAMSLLFLMVLLPHEKQRN